MITILIIIFCVVAGAAVGGLIVAGLFAHWIVGTIEEIARRR